MLLCAPTKTQHVGDPKWSFKNGITLVIIIETRAAYKSTNRKMLHLTICNDRSFFFLLTLTRKKAIINTKYVKSSITVVGVNTFIIR